MGSNYAAIPILHQLRSPSTTTGKLEQVHTHLLIGDPPLHFSLFLYNSLLLAYASSLGPSDGFSLFATKRAHFHRLNSSTMQFVLKAAVKGRSLASQLHGLSFKLLSCYFLCGTKEDARQLFDQMVQRDSISFNTMIHGYATSGDMEKAGGIFAVAPDRNPTSWTAMLTGFSAAGDISTVRKLFDEMPHKDLIAWNAMISGYVLNHLPLEAMKLFVQLQAAGGPATNRVTIAGEVSACAGAGDLLAGRWGHVFLRRSGFRLDPLLGTALVDMYFKCGMAEWAMEVFESLREKNCCTWNATINGLAMNGMAEQALELFRWMLLQRGLSPDEVTFVGVLCACGHGGFLEEGMRHFFHYACMVDLLARRGLLGEAEELIRGMLMAPDDVVWRPLLGGCRIHRKVAVAERTAAERAALGGDDCVLLANLYTAVGQWREAESVSVEAGGAVHEFLSGELPAPPSRRCFCSYQSGE
ncbi:unnamed protein product [Spirodela intermedia]|uniref:Uncharacterized protein n=1 Tax=Spirodela intermedia TaxID=51605 RepID=A0A7I8IZU6_SPIIN|nr:unnamed protein product [Spirodela intermedia]CAA6663486.1 unnamed protein product [Spirodela intermedia]